MGLPFFEPNMSKFAEYLSRPRTQDEFKYYLVGLLIQKYDARGEQIPHYTINNGKLQTESHELRLQYRYMLQGAEAFAVFMDHISQMKANAEQQQSI